jgi:hypothetical protein
MDIEEVARRAEYTLGRVLACECAIRTLIASTPHVRQQVRDAIERTLAVGLGSEHSNDSALAGLSRGVEALTGDTP